MSFLSGCAEGCSRVEQDDSPIRQRVARYRQLSRLRAAAAPAGLYQETCVDTCSAEQAQHLASSTNVSLALISKHT